MGASLMSGFSYVFGFLVVYRSQQAYSRWWEGGSLLQQLRGEWFNAFSSLVSFCNQDSSKQDEVREFQHHLLRMFSLLYCTSIQQVSSMKDKHMEIFDIRDFDVERMRFLLEAPDRAEVCLQWIQRMIFDANEKQILKVAPPILTRAYNQLGNGIVMLNNARKIKDFPLPFHMAQMVTFMLIIHWCATAWVCAASIEKPHLAGIVAFIVTFSYWGITYIAAELEQPFGDDSDDLPLQQLQVDLNNSLQTLLDDRAQKAPKFTFRQEHLSLVRNKQSIDSLFNSKTGAVDSEASHVRSTPCLPDVLVTGGTYDIDSVAVTGGTSDTMPRQPPSVAEHTFTLPRLQRDVAHAASPPLHADLHGRWAVLDQFASLSSQRTEHSCRGLQRPWLFPLECQPGAHDRAQLGSDIEVKKKGTVCCSSSCEGHVGYEGRVCPAMQPSIEESVGPVPGLSLAKSLPAVIHHGVEHSSTAAWQTVAAEHRAEPGSGSDGAPPTVTLLPSYAQSPEHSDAMAEACGVHHSATACGSKGKGE